MKKYFFVFILSILFVAPLDLTAQNKKPKVALVLSGGGAKGLAHIPVLQLLDSLGIVPDLIVGTSMGSVVGGLYAMGYSGDSIAHIAKSANWDQLMGGGISLKNVSVEEKSEFDQYLISLEAKKFGKIKIGSYLLNDQNLYEFLGLLTNTSAAINDFNELPIPFRAVTTDIIHGKEVILDSGSLLYALRASMSIPGIFSPIPYENTLLVDGGVLNNFPVDVAKDLDVDFIIGSDVGGDIPTKENLNNIIELLVQASMLNSNSKRPINQKLCNILIDHSPYLSYSTQDFNKANIIYEEGKLALKKNMDSLSALSNRLKKFKQRTPKLPEIPNEFVFDTIAYSNISPANLALVKARTDIHTHKKYSRKEIIDGIHRALGTTIFNKIMISPLKVEDKYGMQFIGFEKSQRQVNGSLHYDNNLGAGLIVNFTGRNIIGKASRTLISLDIAEQPSFRLQHQKNFGLNRDWWWRSEILGQYLQQNFYYSGENVEDWDYNYLLLSNQFNKNIASLKSYAGIGLDYEKTNLKPTTDPDLVANVFSLKNYKFKDFEIYTQYRLNSMTKVFYPEKGTLFEAVLSRSLMQDIDIEFADDTIDRIKGTTNGFTKLTLNFEKRFALTKNMTGILGAKTGFIFADELQDDDVSFLEYGFGGSYSLGGNLLRPRKDNFIFPGLNEGEIIVNQCMMLYLGMQFNAFSKFYLTPHFHMASVGFDNFNDYIRDPFDSKGDWEAAETANLFSTGITASYHTLLGPVNFDVSWVNNIDRTRIFFGVGIQLNRSN